MKIETTPREDHQVTMIVELKQERMDRAKKRAAREMSKNRKIPGFRPGKVPYPVVVRNFGEQAIFERAVDILMVDVYPKALEEAEIDPGAQGSLEDMESIEPPRFVFTVPLRPKVDLGDYRAIREQYKLVEPNEKEIDARLKELQGMYARMISVDRPIENDDYVLAKVVGEKEKAEEGEEDPIVFEKESHAAHVQEKEREKEEPFMGFAKRLVGMSAGDTKKISKKFPKDYMDESLQGMTVNYEVTINSVQGTEFPELDDEFAKTLGAGETMEELREVIVKEIEEESRNEYDDEYFTKLMDRIKEDGEVNYPPQVLDEETENVIEDIKERLGQQGMEFETYLKMQETTLEKFTEEEARPVAEKRLERGLIFDELARQEEIEITNEELQKEFSQTLQNLATQGYNLDDVEGGEREQQKIVNNIARHSAAQVTTRKTLERLKAIATGEQEKFEKAAEEEAKKAAKAAEEAEKEEAAVEENAEDAEEKSEE